MFLQYPQKLWHFLFCGGEGIERVWEYPNKQNAEHFLEKGTPFLCLLQIRFICLAKGRERNGTEYERLKNNDLLPKRGNPLNETVTYKIGGTLYEVSTVCGGSELLYDKMERLIKSETVTSPTDKEKKVRYNDRQQPVCRAFITGGMNT